MGFLSHKRKKYLVLLPVILLLFNAFFFRYATQQIQAAMLREKFLEVVDVVSMLGVAVEATRERDWQENEDNIIASVEYLDRLYQIYAAVYKPADDGLLALITARSFEVSVFEPLEHADFWAAVYAHESGDAVINYTPEGQKPRDLHIYYCWTPLYSPPHQRYLIVAGVSQYSIVTQIATWVSAGQWASTVATFLLNVWLVALLARLGYVYDQRAGDKWRDNREPGR